MNDNEELYGEIFAALDEYESASDRELFDAVHRRGACGWLDTTGKLPRWSGNDRADRQLVAPICAACPVWRECLEWEFRTHGHATAGVWGPLDEQGRRAAFPHWLERRADGCR